jgi:hypothetical protein
MSHWLSLLLPGMLIQGGGLLHVDMFAHNKSGIAQQDSNQSQRPLLISKGNPISSRGCYQVFWWQPVWSVPALRPVCRLLRG